MKPRLLTPLHIPLIKPNTTTVKQSLLRFGEVPFFRMDQHYRSFWPCSLLRDRFWVSELDPVYFVSWISEAEIFFYVPLWEKALLWSLIEIYCFWDDWLQCESTVLYLHRDLLHVSKSRKERALRESYYRIWGICFNMYITFKQAQAFK